MLIKRRNIKLPRDDITIAPNRAIMLAVSEAMRDEYLMLTWHRRATGSRGLGASAYINLLPRPESGCPKSII